MKDVSRKKMADRRRSVTKLLTNQDKCGVRCGRQLLGVALSGRAVEEALVGSVSVTHRNPAVPLIDYGGLMAMHLLLINIRFLSSTPNACHVVF